MDYIDTVLIVDDSPMIIKVLSFMIKKAGYNILSAIDGKIALELSDGRNIDLVITDFNMPNLDGMQLIKEIRRKESYHCIPVILFIDHNEQNRKEIMDASGATMLFNKTNIQEKLISTIKKVL